MIAWTEQQVLVKDMVRDFVEKEIVPHLDDLEYNGMPPYDILRKLFKTDSAAKSRLEDSINISRGLIEMKVPKLCTDPDTLILTHCGGGGRASLAALTLQEMGYTNVHAITATFDDIKDAFR